MIKIIIVVDDDDVIVVVVVVVVVVVIVVVVVRACLQTLCSPSGKTRVSYCSLVNRTTQHVQFLHDFDQAVIYTDISMVGNGL